MDVSCNQAFLSTVFKAEKMKPEVSWIPSYPGTAVLDMFWWIYWKVKWLEGRKRKVCQIQKKHQWHERMAEIEVNDAYIRLHYINGLHCFYIHSYITLCCSCAISVFVFAVSLSTISTWIVYVCVTSWAIVKVLCLLLASFNCLFSFWQCFIVTYKLIEVWYF